MPGDDDIEAEVGADNGFLREGTRAEKARMPIERSEVPAESVAQGSRRGDLCLGETLAIQEVSQIMVGGHSFFVRVKNRRTRHPSLSGTPVLDAVTKSTAFCAPRAFLESRSGASVLFFPSFISHLFFSFVFSSLCLFSFFFFRLFFLFLIILPSRSLLFFFPFWVLLSSFTWESACDK